MEPELPLEEEGGYFSQACLAWLVGLVLGVGPRTRGLPCVTPAPPSTTDF